MSIETEVAALTTATTNLFNAVNVSKTTLDAEKDAAIAAAASALTSLNDFKGRYYGALSSDPIVDPLGNACTAGDLYFNSVSNAVKVYNTGVWAIVPGATSTDFAAPTGAALIGHTPASSVATTVYSKLLDLDSGNCLVNEFGLLAAHDSFMKLETTATAGPFYVGITGYGDSMANPDGYVLGTLVRSLQMRYGLGGLFTSGFGQTWFSSGWTLTGGAAQPRTDFTYLPGANQITMPAASTAQTTTTALRVNSATRNDGTFPFEFDHLDNATLLTLGFKKVRCFYLTRPGDGTLTFTVSQIGATGYTPSVNNCNAALGLAYVDITVLDMAQPVTLNVAASTAACVFIGAVFLRETGVLSWSSQVGGSTMEQQKAYITAGNDTLIYAPLCAALSTALVIHNQRVPLDTNWQTNYPIVFNSLAAMTTVSQFVLGEPPRATEDTPTVPVINEFLRLQCLTRGYAFFDQYKALGNSNAVLTVLGWGNADGVHLDGPAHRYLAGKILKAVDWFRIGGNKLDADPLTMGRYLKLLPLLQAFQNLRSSIIYGRAAVTMDSTTTSGGYTFTASNEKGFNLNSAAALGGVSGLPGRVITNSSVVKTTYGDVYTAFVGYRNLSLPAGVRAFVLIGTTAVVTTLTTLAQRCYGFECAKGSDVGSPGGIATEVIRLVSSNGTTTVYGPWVNAIVSGALGTFQGGLNVIVGWNKSESRLELYRQSPTVAELISTVANTDFYTNDTAGSYLSIALVGENAGNVPATTGYMTFNEIKTNFAPYAYGLTNNGLMSNV